MSDKPPIFSFGRDVRRCLLLVSFVFLAACQTAPPVQEMSDARMAIAVAKEAGAEQHAAEQLKTAEEYLEKAEQRLTEKAYSQARRDALHAKQSAMDALAAVEEPETDSAEGVDE